MHKETKVNVERKDYLEIEESKVNKVSRDIWVFQEIPVKKENLEDLVILVYLVKWEIKVFQVNQVIKVKEEKEDLQE